MTRISKTRFAGECFGQMNGAPDFASMLERISRLRNDGGSPRGDFRIGCILLAAAKPEMRNIFQSR